MQHVIFYSKLFEWSSMLDNREISSARNGGTLFKMQHMGHCNVRQDPLAKAIAAWNEVSVQYIKLGMLILKSASRAC